MKVSLLMALYNKNDCLPNTLYSIAMQEVSFPFEICIVDDVSDIDPEPIVRDFIPDAKYRRLTRHVGTQFSQSICCELMSDDSDIGIVQSADVMYLGSDAIERMCSWVEPSRFVMPEVKNVAVPLNYYEGCSGISVLEQYELAIGYDIYQGRGRPSKDWLLFLAALTREDLMRIDFPVRCCDIAIQHRIKEEGMKPIFIEEVKAIHQKHPPSHMWPCSIIDSCEFWCMRKVL